MPTISPIHHFCYGHPPCFPQHAPLEAFEPSSLSSVSLLSLHFPNPPGLLKYIAARRFNVPVVPFLEYHTLPHRLPPPTQSNILPSHPILPTHLTISLSISVSNFNFNFNLQPSTFNFNSNSNSSSNFLLLSPPKVRIADASSPKQPSPSSSPFAAPVLLVRVNPRRIRNYIVPPSLPML